MISPEVRYFKKDRPESSDIPFLSLKEYQSISNGIMMFLTRKNRLLRKMIKQSEDFMSELTKSVIDADWTFDAEKSNLNTWRIYRVRTTIGRIIQKINKEKENDIQQEEYNEKIIDVHEQNYYTLDNQEQDRPNIDSLISNTILTDREQQILSLYRETTNAQEIADKLGISRQFVNYKREIIIEKIRKANGIE